MARVTNGLLASLAWTNNTALVSSSAVSQEFAYVETGSPVDVTGLGARTQQNHGTLRSATATITSRYDAVEIGNAGGVAVASSGYYAAHVRQWRLTIASLVNDVTELDSGSPKLWREFSPSVVNWSGTYEGFPSDSVSFTGASGATTTTRAITLTLRDSNTFSGDAVVGQAQMQLNPGTAAVTMDFSSAGDLTKAGSAFIAAGTIGNKSGDVGFASGTLTATYTTGETISGTAFPESIDITCPVDGPLTVQVGVRFTGEVTHS